MRLTIRSRQAPVEESPTFAHVAERFRRAGELTKAVALCQDGLRRFPDHVSGRVTLGWALLDLGKFDDARQHLQHALKRAPDNLLAIRGLAHLHEHTDGGEFSDMRQQASWAEPEAPQPQQAASPFAPFSVAVEDLPVDDLSTNEPADDLPLMEQTFAPAPVPPPLAEFHAAEREPAAPPAHEPPPAFVDPLAAELLSSELLADAPSASEPLSGECSGTGGPSTDWVANDPVSHVPDRGTTSFDHVESFNRIEVPGIEQVEIDDDVEAIDFDVSTAPRTSFDDLVDVARPGPEPVATVPVDAPGEFDDFSLPADFTGVALATTPPQPRDPEPVSFGDSTMSEEELLRLEALMEDRVEPPVAPRVEPPEECWPAEPAPLAYAKSSGASVEAGLQRLLNQVRNRKLLMS